MDHEKAVFAKGKIGVLLLLLALLLALSACGMTPEEQAKAEERAKALVIPYDTIFRTEDGWLSVPIIWKDNSGVFGVGATIPSIKDYGGSNLMNAYPPPEDFYEPETAFAPDEDYDLVFYWSATRSRGGWIFQIAPEGSEEWIDFPRHGEYYAGSCECDAHGQFRGISKFCMNFESETNGMYQIRQIIEGGVAGIEGEWVLWHLHDIPITGTDKLLIEAEVENYANWPYGRTVVLVDTMEYCEYCPEAWQVKP